MRQQTWGGAIREIWRSAVRHKLVSGPDRGVRGRIADRHRAGRLGFWSADAARRAAAPAFSLPALAQSGQQVSLSSYAGKPLIVNFFASWCAPCQQETPLLAKFYRDEHGRVALVGLDENDVMSNALSFTRAKGVSYPVGFDPAAQRRIRLRRRRPAADLLPRRQAPHRRPRLRRGDDRRTSTGVSRSPSEELTS